MCSESPGQEAAARWANRAIPCWGHQDWVSAGREQQEPSSGIRTSPPGTRAVSPGLSIQLLLAVLGQELLPSPPASCALCSLLEIQLCHYYSPLKLFFSSAHCTVRPGLGSVCNKQQFPVSWSSWPSKGLKSSQCSWSALITQEKVNDPYEDVTH